MIIDASGGTCKGPLRDHNEDNIYMNGRYRTENDESDIMLQGTDKEETFTCAVFDGVGGGQLGAVASLTAAETLAEADGPGIRGRTEETILEIHRRIRYIAHREQIREVGTTVAILTLDNGKAYVSNLGDSRIYRMRNGKIKLLSHDHTQRQDMIDYHILSEGEVMKGVSNNVLTQYAGIATEGEILPSPYLRSTEARRGDMFVVCSDGLTSVLKDDEIEALLKECAGKKAEEIVTALISKAEQLKSKDNISTIIVKCC